MIVASTWLVALLAGLLLLSALFSGSETALFRLGRERAHFAGRAARLLAERPRDLLAGVLIGNTLVNVLFFLFAERLLPPGHGLRAELLLAVAGILTLVVCGEILPKVVALRVPIGFARVGAPLLLVVLRGFEPLRALLVGALERITRLTGALARPEPGLTSDDLGALLDKSAAQGLLAGEEADLLYEVVELREVRVREIMIPRVDALFLDADGHDREEVLAAALARRLGWLPVVDKEPDRVLGRVRVRDLLLRPDKGPRQLLLPVKFVPEVASCLDLLHVLRDERQAEAVVVDEWGGTAGVVEIEHVFEQIVGDLRREGESRERAVVPLGEGRFRVDGGLSIRDWNARFGSSVVPDPFETLGGFVTAQLGRIPRVGDELEYGNLHMEVREVRGRRVIAVDIGVRAAAPAAPAEGGA